MEKQDIKLKKQINKVKALLKFLQNKKITIIVESNLHTERLKSLFSNEQKIVV